MSLPVDAPKPVHWTAATKFQIPEMLGHYHRVRPDCLCGIRSIQRYGA
jgi:hypothetical protein